MEKIKSQKRETQRLVQSALLLSVALVIRSLGYTIYFAGAPTIRVGFATAFTRLAGVLFGPLYGGAVSGLADFLGYLIKPEGAYIPWLTLISIGGGVLSASIWRALHNVPREYLRRILLAMFVAFTALGIANNMLKLSKYEFTWIPIIGLLFLAIDFYVSKKGNLKQSQLYFLKLLIALSVTGITVTTINTYILKMFIPALSQKGFIILWIPRLIQELIMIPINAYIITLLLYIYNKLNSR